MLGDTRQAAAGRGGRAKAPGTSSPRLLGVEVDPDAQGGRPRPGSPAAGGDHQGAVARIESADPRRADLDADPAGRRRADEGARAAEGAGPGGDLHHAQAPRGALPRRLHLDPPPGPARGDDRSPGTARGGPRGAARRDRPDHVRRRGEGGGRRRRAARRAVRGRGNERRPHVEGEVVLELRNVSAPGEGAELGVEDVSLELTAGRDPRRRGRRRERPASSGRGDRRPARRLARRGPAVRRPGHRDAGLGPSEARPALRHRRPPGRGDRRLAPGRDQPVPEADRRAAVLEARTDPARARSTSARASSCRNSTCGRPAWERARARSRAGTFRRSCWRAS